MTIENVVVGNRIRQETEYQSNLKDANLSYNPAVTVAVTGEEEEAV